MVIRQEKKEEFREIYDLVKLAFETMSPTEGNRILSISSARREIIFQDLHWWRRKTGSLSAISC